MRLRTRVVITSLVLLSFIATISIWFEKQQENLGLIDNYKTELSSIDNTVALFNQINIQFNGFVLNVQHYSEMEKVLLNTELTLETEPIKSSEVYGSFRLLLNDYWNLLEHAEDVDMVTTITRSIEQHSNEINSVISQYNLKIETQYKKLWSFDVFSFNVK